MVYVIDDTGKVLKKCNSWAIDGMRKWATDNGYMIYGTGITVSRNMVIRVIK